MTAKVLVCEVDDYKTTMSLTKLDSTGLQEVVWVDFKTTFDGDNPKVKPIKKFEMFISPEQLEQLSKCIQEFLNK